MFMNSKFLINFVNKITIDDSFDYSDFKEKKSSIHFETWWIDRQK